jgi:RNA polymerase sigma-70 factor (ECF subfamily)
MTMLTTKTTPTATRTLSRDQFAQLALEQIDAVYRQAKFLTRSDAEADDLVQETYLRALKSFEGFELREFGIRPWLLRIVHNLHVNRCKRECRQPRAVEDSVLDGAAPAATQSLATDLSGYDDEQVERAMRDLPPDLRAILVMWAVEELSYKEMAQVLDIPIGTVMSRLHRARRVIREKLAAHPMARRTTPGADLN